MSKQNSKPESKYPLSAHHERTMHKAVNTGRFGTMGVGQTNLDLLNNGAVEQVVSE